MQFKSMFLAAFAIVLALPALAQTPAPAGTPAHIRGMVEKFDGKSLVVRSREGADVTIALDENFKVLAVARVRLSRIKPGDYVGTAAVAGSDGKLHAQELQVLPEAMRGTAEGHHPWDLTPDSTMTALSTAVSVR